MNPPDTYKSQASLKMAFLQDMLETQNVTETEIRGAFEGAFNEYQKMRENIERIARQGL